MISKNRLAGRVLGLLTIAATMLRGITTASSAPAGPIGSVFVIDMENHNFTQPGLG